MRPVFTVTSDQHAVYLKTVKLKSWEFWILHGMQFMEKKVL